MKVLWLSPTSGAYNRVSRPKGYNGVGWIESLQRAVRTSIDMELALAFPSNDVTSKDIQNGVIYYPIPIPTKSALKKILYYYGAYRHDDHKQYLPHLINIIEDYHPDIIHLFGIENPLAVILGKTDIPVVVHLQGLLAPCDNAFFPAGFNKSSFIWPPSIREWLLRNNYCFAKNSIHIRGRQELQRFKAVTYCMGRTEWDCQVSQLLAPRSKYFHVDEVLRETFYKNAGKWQNRKDKIVIVSTISNTVYKGLDLILKTAKLLKDIGLKDFVWHVLGLDSTSRLIHYTERQLQVCSSDVHVFYKGVMNADDICAELMNASIYVHPSYIDNSPNSLCEAQMVGVPVIATYVGGIPSLVKHGETGFLIPANAPFELAHYIKYLLSESSFAEQLSNNGAKAALARHDQKKIVGELFTAYQNCLL